MGVDSRAPNLQLWQLGIAMACPLAVIAISYWYDLKMERKMFISVIRTIVQLFAAGYFIIEFIFKANYFWVVLIYLLIMVLIAAIEATGRQTKTYNRHFQHALISIMVGGLGTSIFGALFIFCPNPLWDPRVVIPTSGMLISNAISGPTICVDRLLSDIYDKRHEVEVRLSFGANKVM